MFLAVDNDIQLQKLGWMKKGAPPSRIYSYILQVDNYDWLQLLLQLHFDISFLFKFRRITLSYTYWKHFSDLEAVCALINCFHLNKAKVIVAA